MSKSNAYKIGAAASGQQQSGPTIARRINRTLEVIVDDLHRALKTETADIIKIGGLLLEAKERVGHGEWLPWLRKELSMSERTAQRYMKAYEFVSAKNVTVTDFKLSPKALYRLSEDAYWADDYARETATDAVLKEAVTQWVGYDRANEIIDETRAKAKAREEAMDRAMCDDMEAAKRQAVENGKPWEEIEPDWTRRWVDDNWGDERQAEFDAEWEEICARNQQSADGAEGGAPTIEQYSAAARIVPEQTLGSEEDPTLTVKSEAATAKDEEAAAVEGHTRPVAAKSRGGVTTKDDGLSEFTGNNRAAVAKDQQTKARTFRKDGYPCGRPRQSWKVSHGPCGPQEAQRRERRAKHSMHAVRTVSCQTMKTIKPTLSIRRRCG